MEQILQGLRSTKACFAYNSSEPKKNAPKLSLEAGLAFQEFVVFSEIMGEVALKVG